MPATHVFVSGVAAGTTATDVRSTDWNAGHQGNVSGTTSAIPEVLTRTFNIESSNTSAISTFVSYNVPARTLGTNRMLRWTWWGQARNVSTVTNPTFTLNYLHGGVSIWRDLSVGDVNPVSTTPRIVAGQFTIVAINSSGTRSGGGWIVYSSHTAPTFGLGDVLAVGAGSARTINSIGSSATFTITTGVVETFAMQFNWASANSSRSFDYRYGALELI